MADKIKIKSGALGNRSTMPKLDEGELAYRTDTKELYIGTDEVNVRLCGADDLTMIKELQSTLLSLSNTIENITARLESLERPNE